MVGDFDKCFDLWRKHYISKNEIEVEIYRYSVYAGQALSYKNRRIKI